MSNGVFNFNFLALLHSEILGGPKFTLGALCPLDAPLAENFFVPKASTSQYLIEVRAKLHNRNLIILYYAENH